MKGTLESPLLYIAFLHFDGRHGMPLSDHIATAAMLAKLRAGRAGLVVPLWSGLLSHTADAAQIGVT